MGGFGGDLIFSSDVGDAGLLIMEVVLAMAVLELKLGLPTLLSKVATVVVGLGAATRTSPTVLPALPLLRMYYSSQ